MTGNMKILFYPVISLLVFPNNYSYSFDFTYSFDLDGEIRRIIWKTELILSDYAYGLYIFIICGNTDRWLFQLLIVNS